MLDGEMAAIARTMTTRSRSIPKTHNQPSTTALSWLSMSILQLPSE
jgi:hypothetical protein